MRGYTVWQYNCGEYSQVINPSLKFKALKKKHLPQRGLAIERIPLQAVSTGAHVDGAVMYIPSTDPVSTASGALKRIGTCPPGMDRKTKRKLARFVDAWCRRWVPKLDATDDLDIEAWLAETTYSESRKDELRRVWDAHSQQISTPYKIPNQRSRRKCFKVKSFTKWEFYQTPKHPRMIMSRSDLFKVMVGPMFQKISDKVFNIKYPGRAYGPLIKKVPVSDRTVVLGDLLYKNVGKYQVTDYSSFEAHFTEQVQSTVELQLYKWVTSDLSIGSQFISLFREACLGENFMQGKWFKMSIDAIRMSGEMNTSLGNGFTNLMFCLFTANQKHVKNGYAGSLGDWVNNYHQYVRGVFEGDDGLCSFHRECHPTTDDFKPLGVILKLDDYTRLGHASFCGQLFDEVDQVLITDPRKVLCGLGWTSHKYLKAKRDTLDCLLRCKANSYLYQYPGCPIIQSMALWVLRCTSRNIEKEHKLVYQQGYWKRKILLEAYRVDGLPTKAVKPGTRALVEELFHVTVEQQKRIERYFDSLDVIRPMDQPDIIDIMDDGWLKNWQDNVIDYFDEFSIAGLNSATHARKKLDEMINLKPTLRCLKALV